MRLQGLVGEGGSVVIGLDVGGLCVVSDDRSAVYAAEEALPTECEIWAREGDG
jgi:hypothetical protein